ncbi:DUF723 domain-containing protein [Faustovirus]|nr:DUF723 domain-containing protein [Faustovirus]SMH63645.1 Putative Zinc-ribbon domain containing protein [Faustovirus]
MSRIKKWLSEISDIADWWDYEKNIITPDKISASSVVKCWFKCPNNHSYAASCCNFNAGSRCRECAIQKHKNTFISFDKVKDALQWWDYEKNTEDITKLPKSSSVLVWFKCPNNHSYQARCKDFTRNHRCRTCAGIATGNKNVVHILKGRIIETFDKVKDALQWWDYEKNTEDITKISSSTKKKIWMKCPLGHSFHISTSHFKRGQRCAYCSGQKPLAGFNTFELVNDALQWWDFEKNTIPINSITKRSLTKVWMKCPAKGHSFDVSCDNFARGNRCPGCNNKGYSEECIEWLECIERKYDIQIQHAKKPGGEFDILGTRYKADGYVKIGDRQIIFEYHGLCWHGYKGLEKQDELAPKKDKTNAQAYADTIKKENKIIELGYDLIVIWSDDYMADRNDYLTGNFEIDW